MELWYYIFENGKWKRVDGDTYYAFNGRKERRAPTYGLKMILPLLNKIRYGR